MWEAEERSQNGEQHARQAFYVAKVSRDLVRRGHGPVGVVQELLSSVFFSLEEGGRGAELIHLTSACSNTFHMWALSPACPRPACTYRSSRSEKLTLPANDTAGADGLSGLSHTKIDVILCLATLASLVKLDPPPPPRPPPPPPPWQPV